MVFMDFSASDQRHPPVREHTCVGRVEIADNRLSESPPSLHSPSSAHGAPAFFLFRLCIVFGVMIVLARTPNDFDLCRYILGFDVAEVQVHNQRGRFFSIANSST